MRNLKMRKVAKQLIESSAKKQIVNELRKCFYQIMRENEIKQGEWANTYTSNPEWTMCKSLFLDSIRSDIEIDMIFSTPKDLLAYKKKSSEKGE